MVHIGRNVSYLRKLKAIPQKQIADKLKLSQQAYSKIELKEVIDDDILKKIAEVLDFPVEAFHLPDLDNKVSNVFQNNGDHASVFNYNYSNTEKMEALYEKLLKSKEEQIEELRERLKKYEN